MTFLSKLDYKLTISIFARYYSYSKKNPGINLRKRILNTSEDLEETDFDDFETDFMNVHKTHKEHVAEIRFGLEIEKFHIVKRKYFKEKHVNFLTWHDKEQIRYLYNSDPDEWTIEKLSEGFPALEDDVKKILKSKWAIKPSRITSHDRSVQKNWENFKNGQLNLSKELQEHLKKFTNRALNFKPFEAPKPKNVLVNIKSASTEFSDIITSYNKLKADKFKESHDEFTVNVDNGMSMNVCANNLPVNRKIESKDQTLDQLRNKLEHYSKKGKTLSEDEKLLLTNLKQSQETNVVNVSESDVKLDQNNKFDEIVKNKYETNTGVSLINKSMQDFSHLIYPQKISIPKNLWKKGCTYKLNDCYYDDDGFFLYRVPGMY